MKFFIVLLINIIGTFAMGMQLLTKNSTGLYEEMYDTSKFPAQKYSLEEKSVYNTNAQEIIDIAVFPNEKTFLSLQKIENDSYSIKLLEQTKSHEKTLFTLDSPLIKIACTVNDTFAVIVKNSLILLLKNNAGKCDVIGMIDIHFSVKELSFNKQGTLLACKDDFNACFLIPNKKYAGLEQIINVWDDKTIKRHDAFGGIGWFDDDKTFVTGGTLYREDEKQNITIYNDGGSYQEIDNPTSVYPDVIRVNGKNQCAFISSSSCGQIGLYDHNTKKIGSFPSPSGKIWARILCMAFSPTGHYLALVDSEGKIGIWNTLMQKYLTLQGPYNHLDGIVTSLTWTSDGSELIIGRKRLYSQDEKILVGYALEKIGKNKK